jgi:GntR family transcriptional regulator
MFHLRPDSGEPIYQQLVRQVRHAISTGALKPGDRLPTIRQLASEQVVNPNTIARAFKELERQGLVESGPRRGTFVNFDPPRFEDAEREARLKPHLDGLVAEARILGFSHDDLRKMLDETLGRLDDQIVATPEGQGEEEGDDS